jgi:flagellar biosynthesis protein FlhA
MRMKIDHDIIFALFILGMIAILIVPLPPFAIDVLLSFSIALSLIAILLTLFVENTLELSTFPSLLLFLTLFRLGINIASTRLILSQGQAGAMIETFGAFVTEGSTLIGLIVFAILTVVNFIVITKGAGRIAEVCARFTLEALPGKQMAIESDLSSGLMNQESAKEARKNLVAETEFYGAMDGSAKFIRGDAIASILILFINIVGGFCVGCFVRGEAISSCFSHYTRLTIGEGLVSQMPALLLSIAAGSLLTRGSRTALSKTMISQLLAKPKVLILCGSTIAILSLVPGMPHLVMLLVAATFFVIAWVHNRSLQKKMLEQLNATTQLETALISHSIVVEMGADKLDLAGPLLEALPGIRQEIADEIGFVVPSVHIRDNLALNPAHYAIKIKGATVFTGDEEEGVLLSSLKAKIIKHAKDLITRQDVAKMIEIAMQHDAAVVEELIPHKISTGQILKILQNLLREALPINDFVSILEIIADNISPDTPIDPDILTEHVRQGLSVQFVSHLFGSTKVIHAVTLDPKVEQMIAASYKKTEFGSYVHLRPMTIAKIEAELDSLMAKAKEKKLVTAVLTSVSSRRSLCALLDKRLPHLKVISYEEMDSSIEVRSLGSITTEVLI